MKKYFITFLALFFLLTTQSFSEERKKGVMEKFKNATCEGFFFGIKAGKNCDKNPVEKVGESARSLDPEKSCWNSSESAQIRF